MPVEPCPSPRHCRRAMIGLGLSAVGGIGPAGCMASSASQAGNADGRPATPAAVIIARIGLKALRIAVRPTSYVEAAQATTGHMPFHAPFAGPLVQVVVAAYGGVAYPVDAGSLGRFAISERYALARARDSTRATMRPITQVARPFPQASNGVGTITGHHLESSRIIDHAGWTLFARSAVGRLLVVAPAESLVLYTDDGQPSARDALLANARISAQYAANPLPPIALAWTAAGWQVA